MQEIFSIIMAGGRGERFWPRSRQNKPKQLLNLFGNETLLEQTLLRLQGFVENRKILIVTNKSYVNTIRELCPQLPPENIIGEPCGRDTAPCMAVAAGIVKAMAETNNPIMLLLPSDHFIQNVPAMLRDFRQCAETAKEMNALATIGIAPLSPSPDYGYIECGLTIKEKIFKVQRFLEKPSVEMAEKLLAQGNYKWNSGMFVFPLNALSREMSRQAPDMLSLADHIFEVWGKPEFDQVFEQEYQTIRKISLDYAIMEHASSIIVREASFDWDDVGNWVSLRNHLPLDQDGNIMSGKVCLLDSRNCIIYSEDKETVIAGIDLEDMVLIKTADAILTAPVKSLGKMKAFLHKASEQGDFSKYL